MSDALRYEWVRLRTLRSTYWLTGLSIVIAGLLGLFALTFTGSKPFTVIDYGDLIEGGPGTALLSIFMGLIGVFSIGHEYRYGTIRPTLGAIPSRTHLMAAKVLVVIAYSLVVGFVCLIVRYLVAWLILGSKLTDLGLFPHPMGRVIGGILGYVAVYALVGFAFASLSRSIPAAIVTLVVFPLVFENVIRGLLTINALKSIRGIAKFLPFSAGSQVYSHNVLDSGVPSGFRELPGPWGGALIFFVFMLILLGAAWALFEKRDA
ncbi:MAG: type transport system permease protein [Frankiales bacterium]|nr:type transport system permease protein [Frankiales bacterium]